MGLEADLKKEIRMTALRRAILQSVGAAGVIALGLMAPNVLSVVGKIQRRKNEKVLSAVTRLKKKGLLIGDNGHLKLTKKGETYLRMSGVSSPRPMRWDRKWRVVVFDIPEKRKGLRELLRRNLISIGFTRLQDSVWVYPYDCEELFTLLKTDYRLGSEVQYIIADKIERSAHLQKHFGL